MLAARRGNSRAGNPEAAAGETSAKADADLMVGVNIPVRARSDGKNARGGPQQKQGGVGAAAQGTSSRPVTGAVGPGVARFERCSRVRVWPG